METTAKTPSTAPCSPAFPWATLAVLLCSPQGTVSDGIINHILVSGKTFFSCNKDGKPSFVWKGWTSKELFLEYVTPARQAADAAVMLADNRTQAIEEDAGVESEESGQY